jgi:hypothetical protein
MYVCGTHRTRGDEACTNKHGVPAAELAEKVLGALKKYVLDPATLGWLLEREWEDRRKAPEAVQAERDEIVTRITILTREIENVVSAVLRT